MFFRLLLLFVLLLLLLMMRIMRLSFSSLLLFNYFKIFVRVLIRYSLNMRSFYMIKFYWIFLLRLNLLWFLLMSLATEVCKSIIVISIVCLVFFIVRFLIRSFLELIVLGVSSLSLLLLWMCKWILVKVVWLDNKMW